MPPMATSGLEGRARARARSPRPTTGSGRSLLAVAKIGPRAIRSTSGSAAAAASSPASWVERPIATPSPGPLKTFHLPGGPGTRVDTHGYEDYVIPPHYDSLVAKLIVHDRTRREAIARMSRALDFFVVEGIETSIPLHRRIVRDPDFLAGNLSTRFMERFLKQPAGGRPREPR